MCAILDCVVNLFRDKYLTRLENFTNEQIISRAVSTINDSWNITVDPEFSSELRTYFFIYKLTVPIFFSLITLVGTVGNFLVIYVILSKRQHSCTNINILLLNLAFSDVVFLVICVPFITYHFAAENWELGSGTCKLVQYMLHSSVYVTVYTYVSIAAWRAYVIARPQSFKRENTRKTVCLVVLIWILVLVLNTPVHKFYVLKKLQSPPHAPYVYCAIDTKDHGKVIYLFLFIFAYVGPLLTIVTLYTSFLCRLKQKSRAPSALSSPPTTSALHHINRTRYASRILFAAVTAFALCWLPLHTHLLLVYLDHQPQSLGYEIFRIVSHCLAYANSSMNPIIYNYVSRDFRENFRTAFTSFVDHCQPHREKNSKPTATLRVELEMKEEITSRECSIP